MLTLVTSAGTPPGSLIPFSPSDPPRGLSSIATQFAGLAADWKEGMSQVDLDAVAVGAMDLLATALAHMTEPTRSERTKLFSEGAAANVAKRREWVERKAHPPGETLIQNTLR